MDNTGKNKNEYSAGTFAAISTPYGKGGVALVRISGEDALEIGEKMFVPKNGKRLCEIAPNCAVYGKILYEGEEIDDGIAVVFRAPHSFTGEDTVEISCHGGILLSQKVLESAFLCGAKPARPGEFSRTAFLNGKMTLSGAEAVIDLINAENEHQLHIAGKNSAGALTKRIDGIYDELSKLLASVYVCIDYPDEDLSELDDREFCAILSKQKKETSALADSYRTGHAVMEGIKTVIVGRPNTGKSSFLNQLLGRERAIVSPIAGTTRDTVEETATVGRITLRLCDTAGIHETNDLVESLGVRRSLEKLSEAELVLAVFDGSKEATKEDKALLARLEETKVPTVALLNKSDLERKFDIALLSHFETVIFSAKEKEPPEKLTALLEKLFTNGDLSYDDAGILTNARQSAAASAALAALCRAEDAMEKGFGKELAGLDIEEAMARLKDIDGRTVGEDIVSSIFSRFCVGK